MVMFHRIPYAQAFERGKIQDLLLEELTSSATEVKEVDFAAAATAIADRLPAVI